MKGTYIAHESHESPKTEGMYGDAYKQLLMSKYFGGQEGTEERRRGGGKEEEERRGRVDENLVKDGRNKEHA